MAVSIAINTFRVRVRSSFCVGCSITLPIWAVLRSERTFGSTKAPFGIGSDSFMHVLYLKQSRHVVGSRSRTAGRSILGKRLSVSGPRRLGEYQGTLSGKNSSNGLLTLVVTLSKQCTRDVGELHAVTALMSFLFSSCTSESYKQVRPIHCSLQPSDEINRSIPYRPR